MKPLTDFPYQVWIPVDSDDFDQLVGEHHRGRGLFEMIGLNNFLTEIGKDNYTVKITYHPEFDLIFGFKHKNDAVLFKLRLG